jgi:hypothetical protein
VGARLGMRSEVKGRAGDGGSRGHVAVTSMLGRKNLDCYAKNA